MKSKSMLDEAAVRARAKTHFDRNWRIWAQSVFEIGACDASLGIPLHPPSERELSNPDMVAQARQWTASWRTCPFQEDVEWEQRSWARVGTQAIPVRVSLRSSADIARWAGRTDVWSLTLQRIGDVACAFEQRWLKESIYPDDANKPVHAKALCEDLVAAVAASVKLSISDWCALDDRSWRMALDVWDWLFSHHHERCYVRQLPIRGIDTKWIETHQKSLRPLYRALTGNDFAFLSPQHQFRCVSLGFGLLLNGCSEFSISAEQLNRFETRPQGLIVCENLANALSLKTLEGIGDVLVIHGGGFAALELQQVSWLCQTPVLYWGDLDTNGFAILDAVRSFAPHAHSVLMDSATLMHHFDLCVEEPKPASGYLERLTREESETLDIVRSGDSARGIKTLRLEQERIEWQWATRELKQAIQRSVFGYHDVAKQAR